MSDKNDVGVSLRAIPEADFREWMRRSSTEYFNDLIVQGMPEDEAHAKAEATMVHSFPDGKPSAGNEVFYVVAAETIVGYLWIGQNLSGAADEWWVWDIVVDAEHRGKGYGRAAMLSAEDFVRTRGGRTLGLSVFGFNTSAQALYCSLGFETMSIKMSKSLSE